MRVRIWLLLSLLTMLNLWSMSVEAKDRKDKKKKKAEVVNIDDPTLPVPDPPVMVLTPQTPLALERDFMGETVSAHVANRSIMGIDVSHYQGQIDWREVARNSDVHYVYVKATEGAELVDNTYKTNIRGARRAGLKVGIYHFYIPSVSPQRQFQNLRSAVDLQDMDLLPIIDIERRGRENLQVFQRNLKTFIQLVERHYGVKPVLYCSRDFYNKYLSGPFTSYKYMIARYHPDIPELCDNASFVMWQFSSTSYVRGIRGHVDRSCMMDSYTLRDILIR